MSQLDTKYKEQKECPRCYSWYTVWDGHICNGSATLEQPNITVSANSIAVRNGDMISYSEPIIDTKKPKPTVKYVTLIPKMIVIECRCGGELQPFGGITRGMSPTTWKHKCTKCNTWYELKERAGDVVYE